LNVRSNPASAFRRLRSRSEPRTLWIDSICIDQSNTDERSEQVHIMADIYKFAPRAVVWLGDSTQNSRTALKTLR
ncbi:heterokaryon incompatibility, partial [Clohesyomyces aquaticus]